MFKPVSRPSTSHSILIASILTLVAIIAVWPSWGLAQNPNLAGTWTLLGQGASQGCTAHTPCQTSPPFLCGADICGSFVMGDPDIRVRQSGSVLSASEADGNGNPFALSGTAGGDQVTFTISGTGITPGIGPAITTYEGTVHENTISGDFLGSASWTYDDGQGHLITETATWNGSFTVSIIPAQRCVGAEGSQCAWPVRRNHDRSYTGTVSVGSILHDNCCIVNYPNGHMCNNGGADNVCRAEWEKAISNSNIGTRRNWTERRGWGPYVEGDSGDDIAKVPARRSEPQADYETAETLGFAAPPNTRLDITDEDFCESRRFQRQDAKRGFGVCE